MFNTKMRRFVFNASVKPHFGYACALWYPYLSKNLKKKQNSTFTK